MRRRWNRISVIAAIAAATGLSVLAPAHMAMEPHVFCPVAGRLVHSDCEDVASHCHAEHDNAAAHDASDHPDPQSPHRHDASAMCSIALLLEAPGSCLQAPPLVLGILPRAFSSEPRTGEHRPFASIPTTALAPNHSPPSLVRS